MRACRRRTGPRAALPPAARQASTSRSRRLAGWLLETGRVDPPPRYAIEQAAWPDAGRDGVRSAVPTLGEVASGRRGPALVSLLLGGRPAGHCLIGTSLRRSLLEEPEGPETVRRLAERAVRVAPRLENVSVIASWSGRRGMTPDGLPVPGPAGEIEGLDVLGGLSSIGMVDRRRAGTTARVRRARRLRRGAPRVIRTFRDEDARAAVDVLRASAMDWLHSPEACSTASPAIRRGHSSAPGSGKRTGRSSPSPVRASAGR